MKPFVLALSLLVLTPQVSVSPGGGVSTAPGANGYWYNIPFSAADFSGSGTWTVQAGDVLVNQLTRIGNTVHWRVNLTTTTTAGTNFDLRVNCPVGLNSAREMVTPALMSGTTIIQAMVAQDGPSVGRCWMVLRQVSGSFPVVTDTLALSAVVTFEAQ